MRPLSNGPYPYVWLDALTQRVREGGPVVHVAAVFAGASWQRYRTHFITDLLMKVPKSRMVATLVRSIFEQPSTEEVWAQHTRVVEQVGPRFPDAARLLADAAEEVLAFTQFRQPHCGRSARTTPLERLNLEIRRCTDVVGSRTGRRLPNRPSATTG